MASDPPRSGAASGVERPPLDGALLFPEPHPPLSHLGVTLLREVVAGGLRFALYQLGFEPPDRPPVRIRELRLGLDADALQRGLAPHPGGAEVAAALVDPGGAGRLPPRTGRLRGAAAFHGARLRLGLGRRLPALRPPIANLAPEARWIEVRERLVRCRPALYDALLGELLASLARRRRRALGRAVPDCLPREARRFLEGRRARLDRLGPPDPLLPSWAEEPLLADAARRRQGELAADPERDAAPDRPAPRRPAPGHPLRHRFRECWRGALDRLRPAWLELARDAADRGLLSRPEDAFFLPWDLASDLALPSAPSWLGPAVAANRREWETLVARGGASEGPPAPLSPGP